jgi:hypothetical protein
MDIVQVPRPTPPLELAPAGGPVAAPSLDALFD